MLNPTIAYRLNFIPGESTAYKQSVTLSLDEFNFIQKKISEQLNLGVPYGNHLQLLQAFSSKDKKFKIAGSNLSTAKFIKNLCSPESQKRFLEDRNTIFFIKL